MLWSHEKLALVDTWGQVVPSSRTTTLITRQTQSVTTSKVLRPERSWIDVVIQGSLRPDSTLLAGPRTCYPTRVVEYRSRPSHFAVSFTFLLFPWRCRSTSVCGLGLLQSCERYGLYLQITIKFTQNVLLPCVIAHQPSSDHWIKRMEVLRF